MKLDKKFIIFFAALFILIETAAVFYAVYGINVESVDAKPTARIVGPETPIQPPQPKKGFWEKFSTKFSYLTSHISGDGEEFKQIQVVRLGILPDVSKKISRKFWSSFLQLFRASGHDFVIEPYIAHSYAELLSGFTNGSLDLIFVNPTTYEQLNSEYDLTSIACQRFNQADREKNRCVLLTNRNVEFLNQTRDLKMTFVDKFSLTGYIIPQATLKNKMAPTPLDKWFSEIIYAPTKSQAFIDMLEGETDIIATDRLSLSLIINHLQCGESNLTELWVSRPVPESILCCFTGFAENKSEIMKQIREIIQVHSNEDQSVSSSSISFELTDYNFAHEDRLKSLTKYIEQLKRVPTRSNVLMKIGGE